jgi:hypothetical protein
VYVPLGLDEHGCRDHLFEHGKQPVCRQFVHGMLISNSVVVNVPADGAGGRNGAAVRRGTSESDHSNFLQDIVT